MSFNGTGFASISAKIEKMTKKDLVFIKTNTSWKTTTEARYITKTQNSCIMQSDAKTS